MVFDGISGVIAKTLVNWKMIHYIPQTFGGFSSQGGRGRAWGEGGAGPRRLVRKDPLWEQPNPAQRIWEGVR